MSPAIPGKSETTMTEPERKGLKKKNMEGRTDTLEIERKTDTAIAKETAREIVRNTTQETKDIDSSKRTTNVIPGTSPDVKSPVTGRPT